MAKDFDCETSPDTGSDANNDTDSDSGGDLAGNEGVDLNELDTGYPPNRGFVPGTEENITLQPGEEFDRYARPEANGYDGRYAAPVGTPVEQRSLPAGQKDEIRFTFEVKHLIEEVTDGIAAPAHGQPGGGKQYEFQQPIETLVENGDVKVTAASFEVDNKNYL